MRRRTQPDTANSPDTASFGLRVYLRIPCEQAANSPNSANSPDRDNTGHNKQPGTANTGR
eukprot:2760352-Alexandrium_andersonii.AAC.1